MAFKVTSRFVVFWICCASIHLFAQQKELVSRLYTMKDGLPDQLINDVMQDSHGFIWVATHSGLSKFDGMRFTTYRNNSLSTNSLKSNLVYSVLEDKMGRLWIGHAAGLDLFDPRTERFYFNSPDTGFQKNSVSVGKIRERRDGKIWICTAKGVYVADPETLNVEKFPQISSATADIAETDDGSVVAGCWEQGVYYMDAKTGETTQFPMDHINPVIGGQAIRSVMVDKMNRIWVGTSTGLELFNPSEISFTHYPTKKQVFSIQVDPDGQIRLAGGDGLYMFDPESGKMDKLADDLLVMAMTRDRQGTVWTSSYKGLQQRLPKSKQFTIHRQFGQGIGSIVEDLNGEVWIFGGDMKGDDYCASLIKLNPALGTVSANQVNQLDARVKFGIGSLFLDQKKNMMVTYERMLGKYISESQTFETIEIKGPDVGSITSFMDSHGKIWFGGWDGVKKFDPKTATNKRLKAFAESTVHSFLEDSSQNLWIGSTAGLTRYNLTTGKLDLFTHQSDDPQSLSNNIVYHVIMDSNKNIWVGTGGGLNKMIKGTENDVPRFLNWRTTQSGLPNDDVYCVVDGGDGTLWMTCGNMISHFFPEQNTFRNYDSDDGLSGENFRGLYYLNGRGLRSQRGNIYFGSNAGVVVFHPDSLQNNSFIPPVTITGFSIHNKAVPVGGTGADTLTVETPLTQAISYTHEIRLTHDQNDFNFEFAALNFVNPERNQYKYKLEPYEEEWIETNASNRFARYTNISPGKYTFRVIGSNNDGVWNEEGATLVIIIAPPWWKTWWAYTLYGIVLAGLLIASRRNIIQRERLTSKLKLEHLELEKVQEIDKVKTNFFANISHEFRTPITLIQGPLKEMYNKASDEEERSVIGIMLRNAKRLSRLINQLLDLSKLEAGKMKLHANPVELVQFLREISSSYESIAADKKIKYFFYPEVAERIAYIDAEKIEKVVHNLLSNAFKFTKEGGEIILYLKQDKEHCSIIVKDTGIGIPAGQLDKIFDRFHQVDSSQTREHEGSGLGMALAKELVELHHGTIAVESLEGRGATFTVRLPLGKEHLNKDEIADADNFKKSEVVYEDLVAESSREIETVTSDDHQPILLIVEDNADMRHYIRKTFSDYYKVIEAANGKEGIAKAEEIIPDLIISDVMMPEMDGYKFCERIKTKELTSHIPVILLTAKADHESKLTGLETGADDYLSKPFDADELKLIVRNLIEQRKKVRERFSRGVTLEPKQIAITSFDEKFLNKVMTIIEDHIGDENFSIDELSREVGYSNMHFYRKLKALAGETPSQFLRTIRLKRAAELLRKKSDNVTQIAYSVGFSSLSYFNKCFKEQFGVTPGQFADESLKSKV